MRDAAERRRDVRHLRLSREEWLALARERTAAGADLWIRVRGASMEPALPAGASVRLSAIAPSGPRVGEIVLALLPTGLPVVHRVVAMQHEDVWLRGDAMPRRDPAISREAIIARVSAVSIDGDERDVPPPVPWGRVRHWRAAFLRFLMARLSRPVRGP